MWAPLRAGMVGYENASKMVVDLGRRMTPAWGSDLGPWDDKGEGGRPRPMTEPSGQSIRPRGNRPPPQPAGALGSGRSTRKW